MPNNKRQGFTLIELLLVMGIIAILAGIISSALNIPLMLVNTRDVERKQNMKTIENAMYQHLVDEWELANGQNIPEGEENAKEICIKGLTIEEANAENCVQLDALVDKDFIAALPRDPLETNEKLIGYTVYKQVGRPRIVAAHMGEMNRGGGIYAWTKIVGGINYEYGYGVTTDSSGNVYMSGYFAGTSDFDPSAGVDNHTSNGSYDIFLTKIKSDGTYVWTKTMGEAVSYDITTDADGNVYVSGFYQYTVDFDPSAGVDNHTSNGDMDICITKFKSDGTYVWTKTMGGTSADEVHAVATDAAGNVYVSGFYQNTVDFDPSAGVDNHTSNGEHDIFVTKLQSDGTYGWTKTMGGTNYDMNNGIATDAAGNVYVSGFYQNTVDFDPSAGVDNHTSNGSSDIFLTKLQSDGTYAWTKTIGGAGIEYSQSVTTDPSGNIYMNGVYNNTVDFDPSVGIDNHTSNGSYDIFLTKIKSDGTYVWTKTMGGAGEDTAYGVATDASGGVYITGFYEGTTDFDPSVGIDSHSSNGGSYDMFITKFE